MIETVQPPTPPGPPEPSLPYLIHRVARRIDSLMNEHMRETGLKVEGARVLARLLANDHQRVSDLALATSIEQSALSHMLKRLEGDELLTRSKTGRDGRSAVVSLTLAGRKLAAKLAPLFRSLEELSLEGVPLGERRLLKAILTDLYERLTDGAPAAVQKRAGRR